MYTNSCFFLFIFMNIKLRKKNQECYTVEILNYNFLYVISNDNLDIFLSSVL